MSAFHIRKVLYPLAQAGVASVLGALQSREPVFHPRVYPLPDISD
jgi:hypothetical protein